MIIKEKDLIGQALDQFTSGKVKASLETLDQAISLAEEQGNQLYKASVLGKKGVILLESDQLDLPRQCLEEVLSLAERIENPELKADALSNLGLVSTASGDPGTGLLKQQEATILTRETKNPRRIMNHLGLLGHAYIQLANRGGGESVHRSHADRQGNWRYRQPTRLSQQSGGDLRLPGSTRERGQSIYRAF